MFFPKDEDKLRNLQDGAKKTLRKKSVVNTATCPRCGGTDIINGICKSPVTVCDEKGERKSLCFANLNDPPTRN